MYLDIVLIDWISPDGVLTSYKIVPKDRPGRVVIDRIRDIDPKHYQTGDIDIGGSRVYNSDNCVVQKQSTKLRANRRQEGTLSFNFEHMGIPVGSSREAHGGIYNLLLPPGWRLTKLYIADPYDTRSDDASEKKQFQYHCIWDTECYVQLVEMHLRSGRGSFSFLVSGEAVLVDPETPRPYVNASENDEAVSHLFGHHIIGRGAQGHLATQFSQIAECIEFKPEIFGVKLDVVKLAKSAVAAFKKKIQPR